MRILIPLCASVLLAACGGSVPPPNDAWAAAQVHVGRAEAGGANDVPEAKLQLQLAKENLTKSKALIDDDNKRATSLTAVAEVEAQYALSLAKAAKAAKEAEDAKLELQKAKGH